MRNCLRQVHAGCCKLIPTAGLLEAPVHQSSQTWNIVLAYIKPEAVANVWAQAPQPTTHDNRAGAMETDHGDVKLLRAAGERGD